MKLSLGAAFCAAVVAIVALSVPANAKTAKECAKEWQADKKANQAKGITEKAYVEKCRGSSAAAEPKVEPKAAPAAAKEAAKPVAPAAPAKTTAAPGSGKPQGANQYTTPIMAKAHCPTDTVVWSNLNSKIYHFAGHKDYGHTKEGAYMCEKDATAQGIRAAKNEKHP
jgi:hypothetical protein